MPLSWDYSAYRFASFGSFNQRQPEERRNRSVGGAWTVDRDDGLVDAADGRVTSSV